MFEKAADLKPCEIEAPLAEETKKVENETINKVDDDDDIPCFGY